MLVSKALSNAGKNHVVDDETGKSEVYYAEPDTKKTQKEKNGQHFPLREGGQEKR